ncbi:aldehyde dehydrogenase, partial [Micromonospora zamorensis]
MTAVHVPGTPVIEEGQLVSTSPATGIEAGRLPIATDDEVRQAVDRARAAGEWWAGLGFTG